MPLSTQIFATDGEAEFRKIESEVIGEVSLQNGLIISTGGGVVLNSENIRHLKHNGVIFFLDRELNELLPTPDRPLANSKESIIKRYNERIDIYNASNDYSVKVIGPEKTADEIIKIFEESGGNRSEIDKAGLLRRLRCQDGRRYSG